MSRRLEPLITGEIYHLFNRSINREPIFKQKKNCQRALETFDFYRFLNFPLRLSYFLSSGFEKRNELMEKLERKNKSYLEIVAFCLMPNHYHLLVKQISQDGIKNFFSLFQNGYTKYFNTKHDRHGPVFQGEFKVVRVETEEQLIHLSRYIHLNPYSSYVVKSIEELKTYPWSSLPAYLGERKQSFLKESLVLNLFENRKEYQKFVFDQADYQREWEKIKYLTWD